MVISWDVRLSTGLGSGQARRLLCRGGAVRQGGAQGDRQEGCRPDRAVPEGRLALAQARGRARDGDQRAQGQRQAHDLHCDRTAKLNCLIKRNGHHLNVSGTLA